jgi:hypothetical protein
VLLGHIAGSYELSVVLASQDAVQARRLYPPILTLILFEAALLIAMLGLVCTVALATGWPGPSAAASAEGDARPSAEHAGLTRPSAAPVVGIDPADPVRAACACRGAQGAVRPFSKRRGLKSAAHSRYAPAFAAGRGIPPCVRLARRRPPPGRR